MHTPAQHHVSYPVAEHMARVACADPIALAYEWIAAYAENLTDRVQSYCSDYGSDYGNEPVTVDDLIYTAQSHLNPESRWGGEYITRGGTFEGEGVDPTFWDKFAILKGMEIPDEKRASFFSCSC